MIVLASRIKEIANQKGFETPESLSKLVNVSKQTVHNAWTGNLDRREFGTVYSISKALGVSMEDLVVEVRNDE